MGFWSSLASVVPMVAGNLIAPGIGGAIGGAIGGGVAGASRASHQKSIEDQTRAQRAAEQKYSWATGHTPSTQIQYAGNPTDEILGGAIGGGATGFSMGSAFKGGSPFGGGESLQAPEIGSSFRAAQAPVSPSLGADLSMGGSPFAGLSPNQIGPGGQSIYAGMLQARNKQMPTFTSPALGI